ncbi:MAG: phosphotransferase [Planctomycetota bacterium]|nr:phosphotransferase [Planctomycetota bacterium]
MTERDEAQAAVSAFDIAGELVGLEPLVRGHINRTWVSTWSADGQARRYLHQRINEHVFADVDGLMHNVEAVTRRLAEVEASSPYESLRLVHTRAGDHWLRAADGPWRTYDFVEDTEAFDRCSGPEQAFEVARIFGWFQQGLEAIPPAELVETIPGFFSPGLRLAQFEAAQAGVAEVSAGQDRDRIAGFEGCAEALDFVAKNRGLVEAFEAHYASGRFPARVVHGDTKLNNVLFDRTTGAARAVVDLDTAMPGFLLYDFGDMVRFTAATSAEDERDLSRAGTDLEIYRALRDGYLDCAAGSLVPLERELLHLAGPLVTLVIGMRFLTDHLAGDVYFGAKREGHNLDRARVQFAQVACMQAMQDDMLR